MADENQPSQNPPGSPTEPPPPPDTVALIVVRAAGGQMRALVNTVAGTAADSSSPDQTMPATMLQPVQLRHLVGEPGPDGHTDSPVVVGRYVGEGTSRKQVFSSAPLFEVPDPDQSQPEQAPPAAPSLPAEPDFLGVRITANGVVALLRWPGGQLFERPLVP